MTLLYWNLANFDRKKPLILILRKIYSIDQPYIHSDSKLTSTGTAYNMSNIWRHANNYTLQ